jgi:ComEC/Rec2-related protein
VTGLLRFSDPRLGGCALLAAAWILRRQVTALVALAACAGLLAAEREHADRTHRCTHRLPRGESRYVLQLIDPGRGSGRAVLPGRCTGAITVRWPRTMSPRAGETVEVLARWLPRRGPLGFDAGMLVVRRVERISGTPGVVTSLRNEVAATTSLLFGPRAAMVEALLVGWRGEIDREVQQDFSAAGLVHILSISGFHIGLLAGWILLALRLVGAPRHPAEFAAAGSAAMYAAFLGWPAPAARAALLALLLAWCRWRQREVTPGALLACSAALVLAFDPSALVSVGAWLSVTALWGLTLATRWSDRALSPHPLVRSLTGSVGAMLGTAPLTAMLFGQVAPIAIVLNLVAVPLAAMIVPALLGALALHALMPAMAAAFAASGGLLLQALEGSRGLALPRLELGSQALPALVRHCRGCWPPRWRSGPWPAGAPGARRVGDWHGGRWPR